MLAVLAAGAAFVFLVVLPSQEAWQHAAKLSRALENARSVTFVEYQRDLVGPELVFSRVPASQQQVAAFRAATGAWFAPMPRGQMMCFDPHHRVEIVGADGSPLRMDICFHCQNFTLGESHTVTMPVSWRDPLVRLFTSVGMPPKENYTDLAKDHPDYHLVEEVQWKLDKQVEELDKTPQK